MPNSTTSSSAHGADGRLTSERRKNAVELIEQQRGSILSRIHRLLGDEARKVTDTEEILSTALRRIDRAIAMGSMAAVSDAQFYAFMHAVIERSILEKARTSRRLNQRELVAARLQAKEASQQASDRSAVLEQLALIGRHVTDPIDREVVMLRGRGMEFGEIALQMGMTPEASRKRWSRARKAVRELLQREGADHDDR